MTPQQLAQMQAFNQPAAPAQDPRSAYLAAALQAMQQQPQQSAVGTGENLLAEALDQYAQQRQPAFNPGQIGAAPLPASATPNFPTIQGP